MQVSEAYDTMMSGRVVFCVVVAKVGGTWFLVDK